MRFAICFVLSSVSMMAAGCATTGSSVQVSTPSALQLTAAQAAIDAEADFQARAIRDGQWTAFRTTATRTALMFVPAMVNALDWVGMRADPVESVRWWPVRSIASCDATLVLASGGALWPGGYHGSYLTIWQPQADGRWQWVIDQGTDLTAPIPKVDAPILGGVDCHNLDQARTVPLRGGEARGESADGSLRWTYMLATTGHGRLIVEGWTGNDFTILADETMQPAPQ